MEGYSKSHAPWTDRTSHARQSLHGGVDIRGDQQVLYLSHGVEYGIWLELATAGTMPSLDLLQMLTFPVSARR